MRWIEFELKTTYEATQRTGSESGGPFVKRSGCNLTSLEWLPRTDFGYARGKATPKGLRALADEMAYDLDELLKAEALIAAHTGVPHEIEREWEGMVEHLNERIMLGTFDHYEADEHGALYGALLDDVVIVAERSGRWSAEVYPSSAEAWDVFDALSAEIHADDSDEVEL